MLRPPFLVLVLALGILATSARADVIGVPPSCPPWQASQVRHGSASCVDRACHHTSECGGGTCETRRVCVVHEEVFVSGPGPCRDLDHDGACDRRRETREREAGACPDHGDCAEGHCETRGTCRAP